VISSAVACFFMTISMGNLSELSYRGIYLRKRRQPSKIELR
jgi:hypothetical protein